MNIFIYCSLVFKTVVVYFINLFTLCPVETKMRSNFYFWYKSFLSQNGERGSLLLYFYWLHSG
jgi:hypothetical protein